MFLTKQIRILAFAVLLGLLGVSSGRVIRFFHAQMGPGVFMKTVQPSTDVPDSVVRVVTNSVSNIAGLEEMVVLPAKSGSGYSVVAQVDLGPSVSDAAAASEKIQSEMAKYFTDVFSVQQHITEAQMYFMTNNQIVASAGLGSAAYHKLAVSTGTLPDGVIVSLEQMPLVTQSGENDSWFEIGGME